jgi:hypothetical protein
MLLIIMGTHGYSCCYLNSQGHVLKKREPVLAGIHACYSDNLRRVNLNSVEFKDYSYDTLLVI